MYCEAVRFLRPLRKGRLTLCIWRKLCPNQKSITQLLKSLVKRSTSSADEASAWSNLTSAIPISTPKLLIEKSKLNLPEKIRFGGVNLFDLKVWNPVLQIVGVCRLSWILIISIGDCHQKSFSTKRWSHGPKPDVSQLKSCLIF